MPCSKSFILFATVCMSACSGTTAVDATSGTTALTTEAAFRQAIVGKTLTFNGSSLTINADNTISGPWDGSGITGTWYWDDAYWCREVAVGGVERGLDCQAWTTTGSEATFTRDRGNGNSATYTLS